MRRMHSANLRPSDPAHITFLEPGWFLIDELTQFFTSDFGCCDLGRCQDCELGDWSAWEGLMPQMDKMQNQDAREVLQSYYSYTLTTVIRNVVMNCRCRSHVQYSKAFETSNLAEEKLIPRFCI